MSAKYYLSRWTKVMQSREMMFENIYVGSNWFALKWNMFKYRKSLLRLEIHP